MIMLLLGYYDIIVYYMCITCISCHCILYYRVLGYVIITYYNYNIITIVLSYHIAYHIVML